MNGRIYDNEDNQPVTEKPKDFDKRKQQTEKDLETSDKILNGDLFRFYDNPDFDKVKPSDYNYPPGPKGSEKQ